MKKSREVVQSVALIDKEWQIMIERQKKHDRILEVRQPYLSWEWYRIVQFNSKKEIIWILRQ